jgi:hypothetical protein
VGFLYSQHIFGRNPAEPPLDIAARCNNRNNHGTDGRATPNTFAQPASDFAFAESGGVCLGRARIKTNEAAARNNSAL